MIEPIDDTIVELVTYTAVGVMSTKGYAVSFTEADVQIVLQATRLVNAGIVREE